MALATEAHLEPQARSAGLVRYMRTGKRRSWWGWTIFIGFIVLNEVRGVYVVAEFLKAWTHA